MFHFNNKDLYGVPCSKRGARMHNVGTNLEFRFTSPANIERAVKKYNEQRAAELSAAKKDHKSLPRFCKVRRTGQDVMSMVTSRDLDVVTQLSMQQGEQPMLEDNQLEEQLDWQQQRQFQQLERRDMCTMQHKQQQRQQQHQKGSHQQHKAKKRPRVRHLPELSADLMEVVQCLGPRLCGGAEAKEVPSENSNLTEQQSRIRAALDYVDEVPVDDLAIGRVQALHRKVCDELEQLNGHQLEQVNHADRPAAGNSSPTNRKSNPYELKRGAALPKVPPFMPTEQKMFDLQALAAQLYKSSTEQQPNKRPKPNPKPKPQPWPKPRQTLSEMQKAYCEIHPQPEPSYAEVSYPAPKSQALFVNVCDPLASAMAAMQFMELNSSLQPEPVSPYFLEDSDLEHEYASRPAYLKYCSKRPSCAVSDEEVEPRRSACFVELERNPQRISLLSSLNPIRYTAPPSVQSLQYANTSQSSFCCCEQTQDVRATSPRGAKTPIKCAKKKTPRATEQQAKKTNKTKKLPKLVKKPNKRGGVKADRQPPPAEPNKPRRRVLKSLNNKKEPAPQSPKSRAVIGPRSTKDRHTALESGRARQPGGHDAVISPPPPPHSPTATRRTRKPRVRSVLCSKSLENLKFEKLAIYHKLFVMQERIICALDHLHTGLMHVQAPRGHTGDHPRRSRNAFEFCVHFSRNFLYPLQSMIETVRQTPVAAFTSATSNEACQRVVAVYSLMRQSLVVCQRKLCYFLMETVPQKLCACIELIYTLTNVCLCKGVLDPQDPNVESLQNRCSKLICFIEDLQQERFQIARKANRLQQAQKRCTQRSGKNNSSPSQPPQTAQRVRCHAHYDLKMCLNELNVYEPRLVPKERPKCARQRRKQQSRQLANAPQGGNLKQQDSEAQLQRMPHYVPTQIEHISEANLEQDSSVQYLPDLEHKPSLTLISKRPTRPPRPSCELSQQEHLTDAEQQPNVKHSSRDFDMRITRIMAELEDPITDMGDANRTLLEALLRMIILKKSNSSGKALAAER